MTNSNEQTSKPTYEITVSVKKLVKDDKISAPVFEEKATVLGTITVELFPDVAPKTCHNFDSLVAAKFFDGTAFHRIIPGFVIQGGDPNTKDKPKSTWGMGDPSQTRVPAEFNAIKHEKGILSMARSNDPNSASSQFFICLAAIPHLDNKYTVFGKVTNGIEILDKILDQPRTKETPNDKIEMSIIKK